MLRVTKIAAEFRAKFHKDVVIELLGTRRGRETAAIASSPWTHPCVFVVWEVGYRRHGHNELDEPAFTQPKMYQHIRSRATAVQLCADKLQVSRRLRTL